jgi:hypothetical protein
MSELVFLRDDSSMRVFHNGAELKCVSLIHYNAELTDYPTVDITIRSRMPVFVNVQPFKDENMTIEEALVEEVLKREMSISELKAEIARLSKEVRWLRADLQAASSVES